MAEPVARSAVPPAPPVAVVSGWEVSARRSTSALRLQDASVLGKVLMRATPAEPVAAAVGVGFGRTVRAADGSLVVGSGPGEWTVLCRPERSEQVADGLRRLTGAPGGDEDGLLTVVDLTHGRTLLRLTGRDSAGLLAAVCAIDLHDRVTPDGTALRTDVARVATDLVRDDLPTADGRREPSYLLHCERSSGAYLFDALLDAGALLGVDTDGLGSGDGPAAALGRGPVGPVPPSRRES